MEWQETNAECSDECKIVTNEVHFINVSKNCDFNQGNGLKRSQMDSVTSGVKRIKSIQDDVAKGRQITVPSTESQPSPGVTYDLDHHLPRCVRGCYL